MKPVALVERAIRNSSKSRDIVLDPFGGSGTTNRGDEVAWGFFYANPSSVTWGSDNNPDLYVKVWYDAPAKRIDVNFFHVSAPDIKAYSGFANTNYDNGATTTQNTRYTRHEYFK